MKLKVLLSAAIGIFIFSSVAICASNDATNTTNTVKDLLASGYKKLAENDPETALENFNKAIAIDPKNSQAYVGLGDVYTRKENAETAIENFNKAISIYPNNAQAYVGLGKVYVKKGEAKTAIENFNKALSIDTNNAYAYVGLYNVYSSLNDADSVSKKEEVLKKLEKLDKTLADKISGPQVK